MTRAIFSFYTFTNVLISMFHDVSPAASNLAFFHFFLQLHIDTFHRYTTGCLNVCLAFSALFSLIFVLTAFSLSSSVSISFFCMLSKYLYWKFCLYWKITLNSKNRTRWSRTWKLKTHSTKVLKQRTSEWIVFSWHLSRPNSDMDYGFMFYIIVGGVRCASSLYIDKMIRLIAIST